MTINNTGLTTYLQDAIDQQVFPSICLAIQKGDDVVAHTCLGFAQIKPQSEPITSNTLYDIASLTKVVCTVSLCMMAYQESKLNLNAPVQNYIPQISNEQITIRHLLNHNSGLAAWRPFHVSMRRHHPQWLGSDLGKRWVLDQIIDEANMAIPSGKVLYSDLGFILLGHVLEVIYGSALDNLFEEKIARPLGMDQTKFHKNNRVPEKETFAATENCPWRKSILKGQVMDGSAYIMGGVAGHAGLFSHTTDLLKWFHCLRNARAGKSSLFLKETFELFCNPPKNRDYSKAYFNLGFDTPGFGSTAGLLFSKKSIGHLAYTGCSIWWDLEKDIMVLMLTNRVHPSRKNTKIRQFRPKAHDFIMKSLGIITA